MAIGDALVRGPAVWAGVAAVFDERYFGVVPAENMLVGGPRPQVDRAGYRNLRLSATPALRIHGLLAKLSIDLRATQDLL
jgi:hypothetical protein